MNDDENRELDEQNNAPETNDNFATYDDYDIISDNNEEQEPSEEEQAEEIENQVKSAIEDKAKEAAKEATKKAAKAAGKAVKKGLMTAVKFLFTPPVLFITLAVLLVIVLILLIFMVVAMVGAAEEAPYENVNPSEGSFATSFGITGDKFYGARAIYYNPTQAKLDLKDYYNAFSEDFLDKVDAMEQIDLNINVDLENITPEMTTIIAKAVSASSEDSTLDEYLNLVTHFGYTNIELDNIQINFVDYLVDNQSTLLTISDDYSGNLENDLNSLFDNNYSNYNVTAPLYYVKDIILEDNEEAMLPTLEAQNYVALLFMPKADVNFNSTSFMFYFPNEDTANYATSIDIEFISSHNGTQNTFYTAKADSTWWEEDYAEKIAEIEEINTSLPVFNSINTDSPFDNVNLYSMLINQNDNTISVDDVNNYFSLTLIEDEENHLTYYTLDYLPTKDETYLYLKLNANGIFQFCEYITEFE